MNVLPVLAVEMQQPNDANVETIGQYLSKLLVTVLEEEEDFSGKRPFGNSGWKWELYATLAQAEDPTTGKPFIEARLDEDGWIEDMSDEQRAVADALLIDAINAVFTLELP